MIDKRNFCRIVDNLPYCKVLALHQDGEPTLHPLLPELVKYACLSNKHEIVMISTNLLARPPIYFLNLVKNGLNHLTISIDTLDQGTADLCRKGTDVDLLWKNLNELHKIINIPMTIAVTLSKINLYEIPVLIEKLSSLKDTSVVFQPIHVFNTKDAVIELQQDDISFVLNCLKKAKLQNPEMPIYPGEIIQYNYVSSKKHFSTCARSIKNAVSISLDGDINPCMTVVNPSLLETNLVQANWNDCVMRLKMNQLLIKRIDEMMSDYCGLCNFYVHSVDLGDTSI